jgi:hypothetical protein
MADGLYRVVGRVDDGQQGGQDAKQNGSGHQGDGSDIQLVQQERPLPAEATGNSLVTPGDDQTGILVVVT